MPRSKPEPLTQERIAKLEEQVLVLHDTLASWRQAGMPEKTLIVLLSHYTKVPQKTIKLVLDGMDNLYEEYFQYDDEE